MTDDVDYDQMDYEDRLNGEIAALEAALQKARESLRLIAAYEDAALMATEARTALAALDELAPS